MLINTPAGSPDVVAELGEPATSLVLPAPDVPVPDAVRTGAVSKAHGIQERLTGRGPPASPTPGEMALTSDTAGCVLDGKGPGRCGKAPLVIDSRTDGTWECGSSEGLIVRAEAVTAQRCLRHAATKPAPIPCDPQ